LSIFKFSFNFSYFAITSIATTPYGQSTSRFEVVSYLLSRFALNFQINLMIHIFVKFCKITWKFARNHVDIWRVLRGAEMLLGSKHVVRSTFPVERPWKPVIIRFWKLILNIK
jgi:hypothetical protein